MLNYGLQDVWLKVVSFNAAWVATLMDISWLQDALGLVEKVGFMDMRLGLEEVRKTRPACLVLLEKTL